jgi:hypothetical protein
MQNFQNVPPLKNFVRLAGTNAEIENELGPLAALLGTWKGSGGWNLVAVPNGASGFLLLIQNYTEVINFTAVSSPVPNRGGTEEQMVGAVIYDLTVTDNLTGGVLHVENGMWLNLAHIEPQAVATNAVLPPPAQTIARQASIPHGDAVLVLGNYFISQGTPPIPDNDSTPLAGPDIPLGYLDQYLQAQTKFPGFDVKNPNATLRKALDNQQIGKVTTFVLDTSNILNIPFTAQHVDPNNFTTIFWVEEVTVNDTSFLQLQYTQQTNFNFLPRFGEAGLIMWPHININTLVKQ